MPEQAEFDIIIFGASGYTGKCVLTEFVRQNENEKYSLAIAGRNVEKLAELLRWIEVETGN